MLDEPRKDRDMLEFHFLQGGSIKLNKIFTYNSGCLAVIIRLLFNSPGALQLQNRRKGFVIVVSFKRTPQRDNRVKVSALFRAGHKVSKVANLFGSVSPIKRNSYLGFEIIYLAILNQNRRASYFDLF